jgi:hypothetical protein
MGSRLTILGTLLAVSVGCNHVQPAADSDDADVCAFELREVSEPNRAAGAAEGGIGSWGDAIAYVGDGGHAAWMIGQSQDVGYKYSHVAVLGLNLWAWDGTYCVYQRYEKKYVPISKAQAAQLLGKAEGDLWPPFEYRCPLGLFIFGPFFVLGTFLWGREMRARQSRTDSTTASNESVKEADSRQNGRNEDLS